MQPETNSISEPTHWIYGYGVAVLLHNSLEVVGLHVHGSQATFRRQKHAASLNQVCSLNFSSLAAAVTSETKSIERDYGCRR
jgi:hypothetical protein